MTNMFKINSCEDQNYSGIPERERGGGSASQSERREFFMFKKSPCLYMYLVVDFYDIGKNYNNMFIEGTLHCMQ